MPRYYFDTVDGGRDIDNHGIDLSGDDEALGEAARYAGDLLRDEPGLLDQGELTVTARSEGQREVVKIRVEVQRPA